MSGEDALRAKNDQLLSGIRDALHLVNVKALAVVCPSCGSKIGRSCYGNGPMAVPHPGRTVLAQEELKRVLLAALETGVKT
jgi:hypothetical protein